MWKKDKILAYLLLRIALGLNILMHGIVRLPNMDAFVEGVSKSFESTWLPQSLVTGFAYFLPYAEGLIGMLILAGAWTRWALFSGGILMSMLIFGKTLQQEWATVGTQMIYVLSFFFALFFIEFNAYCIDKKGS